LTLAINKDVGRDRPGRCRPYPEPGVLEVTDRRVTHGIDPGPG
jgi:hypothetical protein